MQKGCPIKNILNSLAAATALLLGAWAYGASPTGPTGALPGGDDVTSSAAKPSATIDADDLDRILTNRPAVPVTAPRTGGIAKPAKPKLPADESPVLNRRCSMGRDEATHWAFLRYEAAGADGLTQQWALPCKYLEEMEKHEEQNPGSHYRISGETFVYMDRAFLLLTKVTVEMDSGPADISAAATTLPASAPSASAPTAAAGVAAAASQIAASKPADETVSSDDVMSRLLSQKAAKPILLPVETRKAPSDAVPTIEDLPAADAITVANRTVRFSAETGTSWVLARFESDNNLQEPPLRMLPCRLLQKSEVSNSVPLQTVTDRVPKKLKVARQVETHSARYRISGDITEYRGKKYLLLRKVLPERDMGQF